MAADNMSLQYTESGDGDPVVLLDWTPWQSRVLADSLAASYRVASIDPPWFDKLAMSGTESSPDDVAASVARVAEAGGLPGLISLTPGRPYALVGVSLGADAALRLALLRPQSVSTLVLVSPTCVGPSAAEPWHTPELAASAMLAHPSGFNLAYAGAESPRPSPERTALLSSLAERWRATEVDVSQQLPELACATLVVFGQEDRLVSREAGGIWKAQVPNCSLSYVYDAGHAIAVDRPDALTNVVLDFVERRETFIVENRPSVINP